MIKTDKIIKYGLYLILFLPLTFTSFTFFPWQFGKTMFFQIIVEMLVFFWLYNYLSSQRKLVPGGQPKWFQKLNFLDWSILAFLAVITITAFTGVNPANSFWGNQARANGVFTWWHFGAYYFLLIKFFLQKSDWHIFFKLNIAIAFGITLSVFFERFLPGSWQSISGGGIIGNRAFFAAYILLSLGVALYLFVALKNVWRYLFLIVSLFFLAALYFVGIRGAILGLVIGVFTSLILSIFILNGKKIKIAAITILIFFGLISTGFFFLRQNQSFQRMFPKAYSFTDFSAKSSTGATRLMAWQAGLKGIYDKPFLGWGLGNYEIIFNKYYNPQFLKLGFTETVWDKPHNWLLEVWDSAGFLGVISYLSILFFVGFYLFRKKDQHEEAGLLFAISRVIIFSVLIAYFVQDFFLFETSNGLIVWFAILAFVSAGLAKHAEDLQKINTEKFVDRLGFKIAISFLLFFSLYFFNYLPLRSSYYMRQAEQSTALMEWVKYADKALSIRVPFLPENAIFLAQQFIQFDKSGAIINNEKIEEVGLKMTAVLDSASNKYIDNLSFPTWAGQIYLVLGEKIDPKYYDEAIKVLLKAEAISTQKQETLFLLGRGYLLQKKFNEAIEIQKKAVEISPNLSIGHWFLGLSYIASGNRERGIKEIEKAQDLGFGFTADQKLYILDLYALEKNYPKLIDEYKKLIEAEPGNLDWYIKLAVVYAESGDKKSALDMVQYVVKLSPPIKAEADKFIKQYKLE